jgi:outer membrane receptor protein involved in Fe transport
VDANFTGSGLTTSESILALLPAPNAPGDHNGTNNNFTANGSGSFNDYQYVGRVDYSLSQRMQIFGRYTHAHFLLSGQPVFGPAIGGPGLGYLGLAGQSLINNYSVAAGFNYTLSNTLLTDFRFGYFRYNPHSTKYDQGNSTAASSLGLPGLNTTDVTTNGLPAFFFDGLNMQFGEDLNIGRCNCPLIEKEQGYQFANNWTKIVGNHQFKFGADLRHATNLRVPSDANRTGEMHFQHDTTGDGLGSGGLDIATFLFGAVSHFNRYVGSASEPSAVETQNRYFFYGQDTWRATHKLTVNYGLRWEFYTPEYVNGKANGGFAVLPEGVIRVAGYGGISSNGSTKNNFGLFAPRLGIAYELTPKTVVRMGYGRSFDIGVFGSLFGHTVTQNLPVLANQQLTSPTGDDRTTAYNFTQGPAPGETAFPVIPSNGILPLYGICPEAEAIAGGGTCGAVDATGNVPFAGGTVSPHIRPDKLVAPTVDAWNVSVQHQLTNKLSVEAAYVANHGSHTFKGTGPSYNPNQPTVVGYPTLTFNQRAPYANAFTTPYTYADGYTANIVCCDGSQGFGYNGNDGTNSFKALELTVNQRTGGGLTLSGSYTYSRAYDNDGSYQPDLRVGYGRQDYNRDSVLIMTAIYELPFGKGKRYMSGISRPADLLLGGWQWNATFTIGSGVPFTPSYSNCGQDRDTGPCRPSKAGSFHMGAGSFNNQTRQVVYFTPVVDPNNVVGATNCPDANTKLNGYSCDGALEGTDSVGGWARPAIATFGNIQRNSYTGPGEFRSDMSIFKNFTITERVKAQFQAEFFNVFNHPVYDLPSGCIDCSGNGIITNLEGDSSMREMQLGFRVTF